MVQRLRKKARILQLRRAFSSCLHTKKADNPNSSHDLNPHQHTERMASGISRYGLPQPGRQEQNNRGGCNDQKDDGQIRQKIVGHATKDLSK
jgi:hypothetical protein